MRRAIRTLACFFSRVATVAKLWSANRKGAVSIHGSAKKSGSLFELALLSLGLASCLFLTAFLFYGCLLQSSAVPPTLATFIGSKECAGPTGGETSWHLDVIKIHLKCNTVFQVVDFDEKKHEKLRGELLLMASEDDALVKNAILEGWSSQRVLSEFRTAPPPRWAALALLVLNQQNPGMRSVAASDDDWGLFFKTFDAAVLREQSKILRTRERDIGNIFIATLQDTGNRLAALAAVEDFLSKEPNSPAIFPEITAMKSSLLRGSLDAKQRWDMVHAEMLLDRIGAAGANPRREALAAFIADEDRSASERIAALYSAGASLLVGLLAFIALCFWRKLPHADHLTAASDYFELSKTREGILSLPKSVKRL